MHSAWDLLFYNPDFWNRLSKHEFCILRLVCKEFKNGIPEREAIMCIFRKSVVRKVDLVRILPLTVNCVVKLRSPVNFVDALKIAERKTGGFANCMAMVRERGWRIHCVRQQRRMRLRDDVVASLLAQGVSNPPFYDPVFQSALNDCLLPVVVWRYTYKYTQIETALFSYRILGALQRARKRWYNGIHRDMRDVLGFITHATVCRVTGERLHVLLSGLVLMVGVISFQCEV